MAQQHPHPAPAIGRLPSASRTWLRCAALVVLVVVCAARAEPADAIIGGQPAAPGYFGYVTFVGASIGDGTALYCTGALVAPSVVLTAAHCAVRLTDEALPAWAFTVGTGRVDLTDTATGQVLGVSSVALYPGWNEFTRRGDVALLQLAQPSTAPMIPIAAEGDAGWAYARGTPTIVAGWGRTGPSSPPSSVLNWLALSVQNDTYCGRQFNPVYDEASMFCASQPGTSASACSGDSGGPAVAEFAPGAYKVIGVASLIGGRELRASESLRARHRRLGLADEPGRVPAGDRGARPGARSRHRRRGVGRARSCRSTQRSSSPPASRRTCARAPRTARRASSPSSSSGPAPTRAACACACA